VSIDPNDIIPVGDLATVIPGQYDHVVVEQNGRARKALAPEVNAAAAHLQLVVDDLETSAHESLLSVIARAEADIAPALANIGYLPPVSFAAGILVDSTRLTVEWGGQIYAALKSSLPFTTTSTFNPVQWRLLQGVTGADLSSDYGAGMVGFKRPGGTGRSLADKAFETLTVEDYGALGNGVADDSAAFNTAISVANGRRIQCRPDAVYRIAAGIVATGKHVVIDGQNSTFLQAGNAYVFNVVIPFGTQFPVTEISTQSVDLSNGTASSSPVSRLTAPGHTLAAGDIVRVLSDDLLSGINPADLERAGEFARVSQVAGSEVWLYSVLNGDYSTNIRIARMDVTKRVEFRNLRVESAAPGSGDSRAHFYIEGAYSPIVENLTSWGGVSEALQFIGCFAPLTRNVSAVDLRTNSGLQSYGYGIVEYSCEYGRHYGLLGHNIRHAYTTGCLATNENDPRSARYGRTKYSLIFGGVGINCQTAAFDTHADAYHVTFQNCRVYHPFTGPSGSPRGFQLRGIGNRVIDCEAEGGFGFTAYSDYAHPDNSRDHEFINPKYRGHRAFLSTGAFPFRIQGRAGGFVRGVKLRGASFDQPPSAVPAIYVDYGELLLRDFECNVQRTSGGSVVTAVNESRINGYGGRIDFSGSTGSNLVFANIDGTSHIEWGDKELDIITGGASVLAIANFQNGNGTGIFPAVNFDAAPSNANGFTNVGATANARNDFYVQGKRISHTRGRMSFSYEAAGNQSISLVYRLAPVIQAECTVTAAGVILTNIASGLLDGQEIVVKNLRASSHSLTVRSNNANLEFDTDAILLPGQSIRLAYSAAGGKWRRA